MTSFLAGQKEINRQKKNYKKVYELKRIRPKEKGRSKLNFCPVHKTC